MSFRPRKDRGPPAGSEGEHALVRQRNACTDNETMTEQQLWQSIRTYLRTLDKLGQGSSQDLTTLDEKRKRFVEEQSGSREDSTGVDDVSKDELISAYRQVEKLYDDEQR